MQNDLCTGYAYFEASGIEALKKVNKAVPVRQGFLRLYRGEFSKEDLLQKTNEGLRSAALRLLGMEKLSACAMEMGINLQQSNMEAIAEFHQKGIYYKFWDSSGSHAFVLTPFVSLTFDMEVALRASASALETKEGMESGLYVCENGDFTPEFYTYFDKEIQKGRLPRVSIVDIPNEKVTVLQKVKETKLEELGNQIVVNTLSQYAERELIAISIDRKYVKGAILFSGNPYRPKESDSWKVLIRETGQK